MSSADQQQAKAGVTSSSRSKPSLKTNLLISLFIICVLLGVALWFAEQRFESSGKAIATQIQALSSQLELAQRDAKKASDLAESQSGRIAQLESSLRSAQEQFDSLDQAWQTFNNGMDNGLLLNDADRLLTLANQQLRLAGNVNSALLALETAQAELIRANRHEFSSLQRAISLDIERLRTAPSVDLSLLSTRLELLITLTSRAPLLVPDGAAPLVKLQRSGGDSLPAQTKSSEPRSNQTQTADNAAPASQSSMDVNTSWWDIAYDKLASWGATVATVVVRDLAGVVSIQRVNDPNALLLSPEQGAQLRENLRARLLTAQLSLLMRQPNVWRDELSLVESVVQSRFDPKSYDTLAAINLVHELQAIPVLASLPDIAGSFGALEATRGTLARSSKATD